MEPNYYQILGVSETANGLEIKAAFKALAIKYHPDKNPGSKFHEEHFKTLSAAYEILSDDDKRLKYDLRLMYERQRAATQAQINVPRPPNRTQPNYKQSRPNYKNTYPRYKQREKSSTKTKASSSTWFQRVGIAAIISACIIMLGIWMASIRNQLKYNRYIAAGNFDMALNYDSSSAEAYCLRAKNYQKEGNYTAAIRDLKSAINYSLSSDDAADYCVQVANLYSSQLQYKEAEEYYLNAVKLDVKSSKYTEMLADFYLFTVKEYNNAEVYYKMALKMDPDNGGILRSLGIIFYEKIDFIESERYLRLYLAKNDDFEMHYVLALCLIQRKEQGDTSVSNSSICDELILSKNAPPAKKLKEQWCM